MSKLTEKDIVNLAIVDNNIRPLIDYLSPVIVRRVSAVLTYYNRNSATLVSATVSDLLNIVLFELVRNNCQVLTGWEHARGNLKTYVGDIANKKAITYCKKNIIPAANSPQVLNQLVSQAPSPGQQVAQRDFVNKILKAVRAKLSPKGLRMMDYIFIKDLSAQEICPVEESLGHHCTVDSVYQWKSRIQKLAKQVRKKILSGSGSPPGTPKHKGIK